MTTDTRTAEIAALLAALTTALAEQNQTRQDVPKPTVQRVTPTRVLLTIEEAAERLGIGRTLMCKLIRTGEVESIRIGRLRRIHVDTINEYAVRLVAAQNAA
jgi:excisionase family DNA binding protein